MISETYKQLKAVTDAEYNDFIETSEIIFSYTNRAQKLRIWLVDSSFVDIWYSLDESYSFHWQRDHGFIYRHDNAPHIKWSYVSTFPKHCHDGDQENVIESNLPNSPQEALRFFLGIVKEKLIESIGKAT